MTPAADRRAVRTGRLQNLAIVLLTLLLVFLAANLPLFGPLSDRSLLELARERRLGETDFSDAGEAGAPRPAFPVRMVYTNDFARLGADGLTTASDEFERAGTYLGEAIGSANGQTPISESDFLSALSGEGLYFDFFSDVPACLLPGLLGVEMPGGGTANLRRALLTPAGSGDAVLFLQNGNGQRYRFSTAVSSPALLDFIASQSGNSAEFAFQLGEGYDRLSPYTLVLSDPAPRPALNAANILPAGEEALLRRAGFNAHTESRFVESSGTAIVREASSALYLRPDGTVDYQGGDAAPGSLYYVPAVSAGAPTAVEAAAAAQSLAETLSQELLGDASLYLSGIRGEDGGFEISFDLMASGTPIRFSDGSHAVVVTIEGQRITAFSFKGRRYTFSEEAPLLLPFAQAAAVAGAWDGAELAIAYVDAGGEAVPPVWIAEQEGGDAP